MGQGSFKKHFKFHNFSEIFYCSMTRLRNTNLGIFIQWQYARIILRNKNMGQGLFKKHSKFQNFDEIFYCDMTRRRSTNFDVFIQYQYTTILKKKIWDKVCLRNIQNLRIDEIIDE